MTPEAGGFAEGGGARAAHELLAEASRLFETAVRYESEGKHPKLISMSLREAINCERAAARHLKEPPHA
jgi:hypothetical protein